MPIIKKSTNSKYWPGCGQKGTLLHCFWICKLGTATKNTMEVSQNLKIEPPYDPAILLLGIYQKTTKNTPLIRKDTCTPNV